jgi:hypothetical protein
MPLSRPAREAKRRDAEPSDAEDVPKPIMVREQEQFLVVVDRDTAELRLRSCLQPEEARKSVRSRAFRTFAHSVLKSTVPDRFSAPEVD